MSHLLWSGPLERPEAVAAAIQAAADCGNPTGRRVSWTPPCERKSDSADCGNPT
jgi:hypothetical protein